MLISLKNISVEYKKPVKSVALNKLSLNITKGEMVAIMGASGCGKSTLINVIAGLTPFTNGEFYYNSKLLNQGVKQLNKHRLENIGLVVQNFALLNDRNVFDNIKLGARKKTSQAQIEKIATKVGIGNKLKMYPYQLSGGECQRVAIARAIIKAPPLLLADEPTGALDRNTSDKIMNLFEELNSNGQTILIVTHDYHIAERCNHIIELEDGKILQK